MLPQLLHNEPLHRFPVVRTTDPDEMRSALVKTYGARSFDTSDSQIFFARATFAKFESFGIGFCAYGAGNSSVQFPEDDFARIQLSLRGKSYTTINRRRIVIDNEQACVTTPGKSAKIVFEPDFEQIFLRIETAAIRRALSSILGVSPNALPDFSSELDMTQPLAANFRELIIFVARQLDDWGAALPPILLKQIEQCMAVNFLYASRHSLSYLLEKEQAKGSFHLVKKAEEYIEAHWDDGLDIETLATVSNISARALFKAFRECRGYSPMAFAKSVRLKRAREMLTLSDPGITVTAVAFRCGFSNLGHFAHDYCKFFGELPSATIDSARKLIRTPAVKR